LKLFLYGLAASAGILGLAAGFYPEYQIELFLGWILPVLAGAATIYFVLDAAKNNAQLVTKTIATGFVIKMIYYGATILIVFKLYSFEPVPFICSFAGFFLGLHALEAVIIKDISK
jgi:F0F1-type ATP synthase assembly protein I